MFMNISVFLLPIYKGHLNHFNIFPLPNHKNRATQKAIEPFPAINLKINNPDKIKTQTGY